MAGAKIVIKDYSPESNFSQIFAYVPIILFSYYSFFVATTLSRSYGLTRSYYPIS